MKEIIFIELQEVIEIQKDLIDRFGGSHGLRDKGLLESAVISPSSTFAGEYLNKDIFEMATSYLYGLTKNHAFIDGNKRVGVYISILFLELNDYEVNLDNDQVYDLGIKTADSTYSKEDIIEILKNNCKKL